MSVLVKRVRAFLHNETEQPLTKIDDRVERGQWRNDGRLRPPRLIQAGAIAVMGSESAGFPPAGTEARVRYQIGNNPAATLALHWNNPLSGSNSFHQFTDADHHVIRVGGDGGDAVVRFVLRTSEPRSTEFLPSLNGFRFPNQWPDTPYSLPPLRGSILDLKYGNAQNGLCGGMVFAARDFFDAGLSIPDMTKAPFGEQDPLFLYLVDRLFHTFSGDTVSLMLKLMSPAYPDTDENLLSPFGLASGRASVMAHTEWPLIRSDIDAGRPSPMSLITVRSLLPWELGKCHQVLAYAYHARGDDIELSLYDPNQPGNDHVRLNFNVRTVAERIVVHHNVEVREDDGTRRPIICFARMNYARRTPPIVTPPRQRIPRREIPHQVAVHLTNIETLNATVVERGRKKYFVLPDCGEREFEFTRVIQSQQVTLTAHPVAYVDPLVEWELAGVPVPHGAGEVSTLGDPHPGPDEDKSLDPAPITVKTFVDGVVLTLRNVPSGGSYSVTAKATVRERTGAEVKAASIGVFFSVAREVVPGLNEAISACFNAWLDGLREEGPTEAAIVAAFYAQLGRPPDPIWCPDPLQLDEDWQDLVIDPDEAQFGDPHGLVSPDEVLVVDPTDHELVVVDSSAITVVSIDTAGSETVVVNPAEGGVTVENPNDHDVVVIDALKHEAVGVVPAGGRVVLGLAGR